VKQLNKKVQYTSVIFLLAVAVQQHKLHPNKERWMHSSTNEQEGIQYTSLIFLLAEAVQQHTLFHLLERALDIQCNNQTRQYSIPALSSPWL
jgi:hypothetical protein